MTKSQFRHYCERAEAIYGNVFYTGDWEAHPIASSVVGIREKFVVHSRGPRLLWDPQSSLGNPQVHSWEVSEPTETGVAAVYRFERMTSTHTSEEMGVELLLDPAGSRKTRVSLRNVTISFDEPTPILTLDLWVEGELVGMDHQFRTDCMSTTVRYISEEVDCSLSDCTDLLDELHQAAAANNYNRCPDLTRYL